MTTPLFDAVSAMEDALMHSRVLGEALEAAGGDQAPSWVHVYQTQIESLHAAFCKVHEAAFAAGWGEPLP